MRRALLVLALLSLATFFQSFAAAPAEAYHRHGWGWGHRWGHGWGWGGHRHYGWGHHGWGHHGWGHHNWGFGRGYVYRPYYRNWNYGYRPYYGGLGYGGFYPSYNVGYYPSYGYTNYFNSGCYCQPVYTTGYSTGVYYDTQYVPTGTIYNYYGANGVNGGLSTELTAGTVISQVANALQQRRANNPDGRLLQGRLFDGDGRLFNGDGRLRGVVQNLAQGVIRNEPLNNAINIRQSNSDSRSKARAYLTQGDNLFREQRYAAAAQQYRAAASLAPDIAECNWRYAHTLVAMGETDLAVSAVQRALAANPNTARNGFTLDALYGTLGTAKDSHLERLAQQVLDTESPNAYFLLGLTLHYSGESERAAKFFAQAANLQGRDAPHVVAFLGPAPKTRSEPPPLLARLPARET
jgi:tetratricopeptide (TPR) repeat protein